MTSRPLPLITRDLSGWRMAGPGGLRVVGDGVIESFGGHGLFWYAAREFSNFVLKVEWRLSRIEDNSGVFLRCPPLADDPQLAIEHGYEVQIDDRGYNPQTRSAGSLLHLTGAIYTLAPALHLRSEPIGVWNEFEIRAHRSCIAVRLNGRDASRLENGPRRLKGHIALQAHHDGSAAQFRNLRISSFS